MCVEGDLKTPRVALPKDLIKNQVYWGKSEKEKECQGDNIYLERIVSVMYSPALQRNGEWFYCVTYAEVAGLPPPPLHLGELMESALPLVFRGHETDWLALAEFVRVKDGLAMGRAEERQHFMITGPHRGAEGPEVSLSPLGLRRDS